MHKSNYPAAVVRCAYPVGCEQHVDLYAQNGQIPLAPLEGWTYNSDDGWRCLLHREESTSA